MKNKVKDSKGVITVIVVVTIVFFITILSAVYVISATMRKAQLKSQVRLKDGYEDGFNQMDEIYSELNYTVRDVKASGQMLSKTENISIKDDYDNSFILPAEFKIASDSATDVTGGIVIEDDEQNQFVWIPIGTIYTSEGKKSFYTITLSRYLQNYYGYSAQGDASISYNGYNYTELASSSYGNTVAKDIEAFKTSANTNGGYYIGRFKAGTAKARTASSDALTEKITEKGSGYLYNYVTQPQAATLARNMYNSTNFTSDLMNSYAYDTAIVFLYNYSKTAIEDGTICNIHDMSDYYGEWTTETCSDSANPCVSRYWDDRGKEANDTGDMYTSFRPILYF